MPLAQGYFNTKTAAFTAPRAWAPAPTKALNEEDRQTMAVAFDRDRCIACEICHKVCPYQTMEILFD